MAKRIAAVTDDAVEAYNRILAQPNGVLRRVSRVGIERRRGDIMRCARAAGRICLELYGDKTVTTKFWDQYFNEIDKDDFKAGRQPCVGQHVNWKPSFEYLTRENVMIEVFESAVS